jgi:NAD(P)-dependent dehydrogenase (short-subunit alcohol dehydrogenase family)
MGKLNGKVALVTGASRGIGQSIAELLGAEGAKVVCAARTLREGDHRLEGSLERTVANITAAGGEATPIAADISDESECVRLVADATRAFGAIDVLVNNAVVTFSQHVIDYPTNRWLRAWAVNVHAPFWLSKAVLPDMIERGQGAIVNITSGQAIGPGRGPYSGPRPPGRVEYGATKAALERMTQGLAEEVYPHGITVAAVAPSRTVPTPGTAFHNVVPAATEPSEFMSRAVLLLATEPLDRVTGRVCYSQQILKEFGWIEDGGGKGIDQPGSGYSRQ